MQNSSQPSKETLDKFLICFYKRRLIFVSPSYTSNQGKFDHMTYTNTIDGRKTSENIFDTKPIINHYKFATFTNDLMRVLIFFLSFISHKYDEQNRSSKR